MLGKLEKLFAKKLSTLKFEFDRNFEANSSVSIIENEPLDKIHYSWVWSLYYAKTLYILGSGKLSEGLKTHFEQWAEPLAAGLAFPLQFSEDMDLLVLDRELKLTDKISNPDKDIYLLEVFQKQDYRPFIQTFQPINGFQNRLAYSVIALGQFFINNCEEFAREIPINILAMKKYYQEIKPFTRIKSTTEAPKYAIKESAEMFAELADEFEKLDHDLENKM